MDKANSQKFSSADDSSTGKGKGVTSPPDDGSVRVGTGGTPPPGDHPPSTGEKPKNR